MKGEAGQLGVVGTRAARDVAAARSRLRKRVITAVEKAIVYLVLSVTSILFLFPLAWMISTSFKDLPQTFPDVGTPVYKTLVPNPVITENYLLVLTSPSWHAYFVNSGVLVLGSLIGQVLTASLVAFSFSRLRWPGSKLLFFMVISTLMLPYQVTLIPQFLFFSGKSPIPFPSVTNSYWPFWIHSFFGGGAFSVFLLRQFMMGLPIELDEAARIDGASSLRIFWNVVIPQIQPALAAVAIFSFQGHWNALLEPLIYISDVKNFTVVLGLLQYQTRTEVEWNRLMAASLLVMLPPLIIFFTAQKYFIQGISLTGIKG